MMDPKPVTDGQLVDAWDKVEDGENLSDFEQAVIDQNGGAIFGHASGGIVPLRTA